MDIGIVIGLAVIGYILYAIFIPPKWWIQQRLAEAAKVTPKRGPIAPVVMGIYAIEYDRGYTSGWVKLDDPVFIGFSGIAKGDYSETVYIKVNLDGSILAFKTEAMAKRTWQKNDCGIVAVTSDATGLKFRDIPPHADIGKDMFKVRFDFMVNDK